MSQNSFNQVTGQPSPAQGHNTPMQDIKTRQFENLGEVLSEKLSTLSYPDQVCRFCGIVQNIYVKEANHPHATHEFSLMIRTPDEELVIVQSVIDENQSQQWQQLVRIKPHDGVTVVSSSDNYPEEKDKDIYVFSDKVDVIPVLPQSVVEYFESRDREFLIQFANEQRHHSGGTLKID